MGVSALTIEGSTSNPDELLRRISSALGRLATPSAAIVFVTGNLVSQLEAIASGIKARHPGLCAVVAGTEGVFTERGEVEAKDGYGCLIHSGRAASLTTFDSPLDPLVNAAQGGIRSRDVKVCGPALHLFSNFPAGAGHQGRLPCEEGDWGWFGAVTTTDAPVWGVRGDGELGPVEVVRLELPGLEPPILLSGACCRIVGEPMVVTASSGATLFEVDNMPALVALGKLTSRLAERSWIVLALLADGASRGSHANGAASALSTSFTERTDEPVFRPLRGIDPSQGALVLKEPLAKGARIAFAVRDDRTAKRNFEEALRRGKHRMSGTAPRFGIYFEGLGRGRQLYGAPNVELSQIRQLLGEFPLLGSRSTLELREQAGSLVVQTMSGQLALFTNPS